MKQYSISVVKNITEGTRSQSSTKYSVTRVQITDNISGHEYAYLAEWATIKMKVVDASDYSFVFKSGMGRDDTLVVPIGALNDIGGTTPSGNNASADWAVLQALINI